MDPVSFHVGGMVNGLTISLCLSNEGNRSPPNAYQSPPSSAFSICLPRAFIRVEYPGSFTTRTLFSSSQNGMNTLAIAPTVSGATSAPRGSVSGSSGGRNHFTIPGFQLSTKRFLTHHSPSPVGFVVDLTRHGSAGIVDLIREKR